MKGKEQEEGEHEKEHQHEAESVLFYIFLDSTASIKFFHFFLHRMREDLILEEELTDIRTHITCPHASWGK